MSQIRWELSFDDESSKLPFALTATDVTSPKWELSVLIQSPELMSQNLMVLSFELIEQEKKRKKKKNRTEKK